MKKTLKFFETIGKLKNIQRRGILFYGFKDADSATDHTFRLAIMAWVFGHGRKLDLAKLLKLALVHDICKVYTGDLTPYEGLFPKDKKSGYRLAWRWRRLSLKEKQKRYKEKFKKELRALKKLTSKLPDKVREDIFASWLDYQRLESPEAKFMVQLDGVENLLEAFESWEQNKKFPTLPWWEHADEVIHDKALLDFLEEIEHKELGHHRKAK
ncbi:MAG: HD domain-containing protein [Candidatus Wildermuthbacteria bacterium]|nr:HD domain-containing protein [Candidatus Wildermuthbacteria bacterium]